MKWMKRIFKLLGVVMVILLLAAGVLYYQVKRKPQWYQPQQSISEQVARDVEDKLVEFRNWSARRSSTTSSSTASSTSAPVASTTAPGSTSGREQADPNHFILKITEPELSTLLRKWYQDRRQYSFLEEPDAAIRNGVVIIGGKLPRQDVVLSLEFLPSLDAEGNLRIKLMKLQAGNLSLPQGLLKKRIDQLVERIESTLRSDARSARIDSQGMANGPLAEAGMLRLALSSLKDQSVDPVAFVPQSRDSHRPLRLTDVKVEDDTLVLDARPCDFDSTNKVLDKLKADYGPK